jgi:hypothetical protein
LYLVDADGVIRDHHFGEGRYEQSERVIQRPGAARPHQTSLTNTDFIRRAGRKDA